MPVYDMECRNPECGLNFEVVAGMNEMVECPTCGFECDRLIGVSGVNTANQDAAWLKSVHEVVDKQSDKPETREFLKNPTRDNYHRWMKAEGIRPFESGERTRPEKPDMSKINREVWERHQARSRIHI